MILIKVRKVARIFRRTKSTTKELVKLLQIIPLFLPHSENPIVTKTIVRIFEWGKSKIDQHILYITGSTYISVNLLINRTLCSGNGDKPNKK